jgi:N-methylhydantoinase A/oxoprolinase/acetone carboxylase beta subunit
VAVSLGIDTDGTFTDLIGIDNVTGELVVAKTPSTPSRPVDAIMNAIARSGDHQGGLDAISIGTTVATNALLQRNGATIIKCPRALPRLRARRARTRLSTAGGHRPDPRGVLAMCRTVCWATGPQSPVPIGSFRPTDPDLL